MNPSTELDHVARQCRARGYSRDVAARRLIDEHGLSAEDASALVQRIYQTDAAIRPYRGEFAASALANLAIICVGVGIAAWSFLNRASFPHSRFRFRWPDFVIGGAIIALAGVARWVRRSSAPRGNA